MDVKHPQFIIPNEVPVKVILIILYSNIKIIFKKITYVKLTLKTEILNV